MRGNAICSEPIILRLLEHAREIFECVNWLQYMTNLQGFHEEITLEFLQNIHNGCTTLKGRNIIVSKAVIVEVSKLPAEGARWADKHVLLQVAIAVFQDPYEKLVRKGKEIHPIALKQPWKELATIV